MCDPGSEFDQERERENKKEKRAKIMNGIKIYIDITLVVGGAQTIPRSVMDWLCCIFMSEAEHHPLT